MTPEKQAETIALQRQMHAYFDSLVTAGIAENVVVTAATIAAAERVLKASTPTQTAAWLRGQALNMEKHGPELLKALRAG